MTVEIVVLYAFCVAERGIRSDAAIPTHSPPEEKWMIGGGKIHMYSKLTKVERAEQQLGAPMLWTIFVSVAYMRGFRKFEASCHAL